MAGARVPVALIVPWLIACPAAAQDARARFEYARAPGAEACPDDASLRAAVAARLGYLPFDEAADRTVRVRVERRGVLLVASVEVLDAQGAIVGARELTSRARGCAIEDALVLAVSLAIDPMTLGGAPPPPEPAPECPEPAPAPPCPECASPPPPPAPRSEEWRLRLSGAALAVLAPEPLPTLGLRMGVGARIGAFSFDVELRGDVPTSGGDASGRGVSASWLSLALGMCGHIENLVLCGVSTTGALVGWGSGVRYPDANVTTFSTAGARVGIELLVDRSVALTASLEGAAVLTPTGLVVGGVELHTVPPAVASLSLGVVAEIL